MKNLTSRIESVTDLGSALILEMYRLYFCYYDGTTEIQFREDLRKKDWIIMLFDEEQKLQGFSTLAQFNTEFEGKRINVLYSGDTIIDRKHWGQQALAVSWLRFAGTIKARMPSVPLYWLLIVKGHRTYRYLSTFSRDYYPAHDKSTPETIQKMMDTLAELRFGEDYNHKTGIVKFSGSAGFMRSPWAEVPESATARPEVRYFLERNPFYRDGEELVCLCELAEHNFRSFSKRIFMSGFLQESNAS